MAKKGKIVIDTTICKACEFCVIICPKKLIRKNDRQNDMGYNFAIFDDKNDECTACTLCALVCPDAAIEVFEKICDCENCDCESKDGRLNND